MANNRYNTVKNIIRQAIETKQSIQSVSKQLGYGRNYATNYMTEKNGLKEHVIKNKISEKEKVEIIDLYNEYNNLKEDKNIKIDKHVESNNNILNKDVNEKYDAYKDNSYDNRSKSEIIRDNDEKIIINDGKEVGKITGYKYCVKIHGQEDLVGEFTREEMDLVYKLYSTMDGAGLTQRTISRFFKHLTFRDFKRILRAFNITKQSIPVAPHILEENNIDDVTDIVFRNKENNLLKKLEHERDKYTEESLKRTQKELIDLKRKVKDIKEIFYEIILSDNNNKLESFRIKQVNLKGEEKAIIIWLADMHIGSKVDKDSLYDFEWNKEEIEKRLKLIIEELIATYSLFGRFDKIIICNMADSLDGYNSQTTRGTQLQQNMNNKEQFNCFISLMKKFIHTIFELDITNKLDYYAIEGGNHDGDIGYISNKALELYCNVVYPDIKFIVFEKSISEFDYGPNHCFIVTHGKDKGDQIKGFPLNMDKSVENYFNDYINSRELLYKYIHVYKADLHLSNNNFGKRFDYNNVSSLMGSSTHIQANYGNTKPYCDYSIVFKNKEGMFRNRISLQ